MEDLNLRRLVNQEKVAAARCGALESRDGAESATNGRKGWGGGEGGEGMAELSAATTGAREKKYM